MSTRRALVIGGPALTCISIAQAHASESAEGCGAGNPVRKVVTRYAELWAAGNVPAAVACYHENFTLHYFGRNALSGDHVGKVVALRAVSEFMRRTRGRLIRVTQVMIGPDRGTILARMAYGEGREADRALVYTVQDDMLRECWAYNQDDAMLDTFIGMN